MEIQFKFVCSVKTENGPEMNKIFDFNCEENLWDTFSATIL